MHGDHQVHAMQARFWILATKAWLSFVQESMCPRRRTFFFVCVCVLLASTHKGHCICIFAASDRRGHTVCSDSDVRTSEAAQ
jgi:hypothetical protein